MERDNQERRSMIVAYRINNSLYLNITNRCPNACAFCIRGTKNGVGYNLWLEREPTAEEILAEVGDPARFEEIVFCGYGEPLVRPEVVIEVSRALKEKGARIRLNTNGLSDLFLEYDVLPSLQGLVDTISISLNGHDPISYNQVSHSRFGEKAFPAIIDFAKRSRLYIPRVVLSVVRYPGVDLKKAAQIAAAVGTEFRIREYQE